MSPAIVNREPALLKHMFNMAERWCSLPEEEALLNVVRLLTGLGGIRDQYRTSARREKRAEVDPQEADAPAHPRNPHKSPCFWDRGLK